VALAIVPLLLSAASLTPSELEESGRVHLYNMEVRAARELFAELGRTAPRSPAGPYFEATTLWMAEFSRRGGMAGATFRTGEYWTSKDKESFDLELDRAFKRLVGESIERADVLLKDDPGDEEALYFRGAAEGVLSAYLASIEHRYFGAFQAGRRAKAYHERLLEVDPGYSDACLLPGIFEYTVATLPRSLRLVGFLVGMRGSKAKGMDLVERAASRGERSRWVARLSLSVMFEREKRYAGALRLLAELEQAFPRNPFLALERGSIELLRKDWNAARRAFEEVLSERDSGWAGFELLPVSVVYLRLGESFLFARSYVEAARAFERALSTPGTPDWVRAQIFLRRGMTSDALGMRTAAQWDYRRAIGLDTDSALTGLAERYLAEPYR
jgi:tetratricopeptide (TPR) repeat protein